MKARSLMVMALALLMAGCTSSKTAKRQSASRLNQIYTEIAGSDVPKHKVVGEEPTEKLGVRFLSVKVALLPDSARLTRSGLSVLLHGLCSEYESATVFSNGLKPEWICVFVYASPELTNGDNLWAAKLCTGLHADPKIVVMESEFNRLTNSSTPQTKYGLTEERRKQVFKDFVQMDDLAWEEETSAHEQGRKLGYDPRDRGKATIAKKYNLTVEQVEEIGVEGGENNWPMPPEAR